MPTTGLYFTDNGAVLCGRHLGATAAHTGHDLSGQPIERITPATYAECVWRDGWEPSCERCGQGMYHA